MSSSKARVGQGHRPTEERPRPRHRRHPRTPARRRDESHCTSANPASLSDASSARGAPSTKNIGHTSDATRASTIGNTSAQPQRERSPHTEPTARPPGRTTRCISDRASAGRGTYIRPREQSATSNGGVTSSSSAPLHTNSTLVEPRASPPAPWPRRPWRARCRRPAPGRRGPHGAPRGTWPNRSRRRHPARRRPDAARHAEQRVVGPTQLVLPVRLVELCRTVPGPRRWTQRCTRGFMRGPRWP